ncbi:MAG TPA: efflux RND transporter periplasmic adaptor subunit [Bacteroidota bacterium]|nr:efflux RND transporter periplasmic adaptor subunit [Bacteroidota bacterium]
MTIPKLNMMKTILFSIFASLAAFSIIACNREQPPDSTPQVVVDVKVAPIQSGSIDETVNATGSTVIRREYQLRSPIAGIISSFALYNGDSVKHGQTVAVLRTKESEASILGAKELLRTATTPAQKQEAENALKMAEQSTSSVAVTAPFDGILSNKSKSESEVVSEGDQFATIIDPASIIFVADIPSSSINRIKEDQHAVVRFSNRRSKSYDGIVHRIEPLVNPADQTARVQIVFSGSGSDLSGSLFGDVSIIVGHRQKILLVPASAVLHDDENNTTGIVLVGADSLAHKIDIAVGAKRDSLVEITAAGIAEGNLVIVQGQYGLQDSTRVRVVR